jgi:hypothetical protein
MLDSCKFYVLQLSMIEPGPGFERNQGMNTSHSVCQESSLAANTPRLLRRGGCFC